jgi:SAM-dependent methyltransferase
MDAQLLGFGDDLFDTVVSTFVFCTVPDPMAGLRELHRVLKTSGRAIFVEHTLSDHRIVNAILRMMDPISRAVLGTSMVRRTEQNIEAAGFNILSVEAHALGVVRLIQASR